MPVNSKDIRKEEEEVKDKNNCWDRIKQFYSDNPLVPLITGRPIKFSRTDYVETQRGKEEKKELREYKMGTFYHHLFITQVKF
jgi:hypothetical protein